jgi:hypothetical protein
VYNREGGVAGLYDQSREPRTIKYKVTQETEETIMLQGKVEAYNKIVKNEFLSIVEDIANSYDGRTRYERYLLNHTTTHKRAWRYKWSYTI